MATMKKSILALGVIFSLGVAASFVFAAASQRGCESSGGRAAGCGGENDGGGGSGGSTPPAVGGETTVNVISSPSSSASSYSTTAATASSTTNTGLPVSVSVEGGGGVAAGGRVLYGPGALHNTESFQVLTPVGGLGVANSEEYEKVSRRISATMGAYEIGLITKDEARAEVLASLKQMEDATQPCRVLGVLWKSRGKHLFNLLGLACTDSWW